MSDAAAVNEGHSGATGAAKDPVGADGQPSAPPRHRHGPPPLSAGLVLGAVGIVFGDIGTSPLYTFQQCISDDLGAPASDPANVMGVVSLIFWSLTLVVTIKYLNFMMRADNEGEGGIMALLALVPEKLRTAAPGRVSLVAALVIVGAALLFGDGIITPAISVLSAVEGLGVATAALKPFVVPITVLILVALFAAQRRGTGSLGFFFGPVMLVWFSTIAVLGAMHVASYPAVLGALSPTWGVAFFAHHGIGGIKLLGGVVLAVTGGEALYADMGHFGARPIRIGWLGLVYPSLVLCYLGQGAQVLQHPETASDPFYALVGPNKLFVYPMVLLAAAATVIASQALISGVFSLTHQAIRLGFFPRVEIKHTSGEAEGQIYVPLLNWGLAISCVTLVLMFRESAKLAAAYGLAVSGTMLITSIIYFVVVRNTWHWSLGASLGALLFFLTFDVPFVVANSLKFFEGGYLPFAVGVVFTVIMVVWRMGRGLLTEYFASEPPITEFLAGIDEHVKARLPGTAVVLTVNSQSTPPVLDRLVSRFHVLHEHVLLMTVTTEHTPTVDEKDRYTVEELGHGFLRVIARWGFMEQPEVPELVVRVLADTNTECIPQRILYVLGRETLVVSTAGKMDRFSEPIFAFLARNARSAANYFRIPTEQVIELGAQVDL